MIVVIILMLPMTRSRPGGVSGIFGLSRSFGWVAEGRIKKCCSCRQNRGSGCHCCLRGNRAAESSPQLEGSVHLPSDGHAQIQKLYRTIGYLLTVTRQFRQIEYSQLGRAIFFLLHSSRVEICVKDILGLTQCKKSVLKMTIRTGKERRGTTSLGTWIYPRRV